MVYPVWLKENSFFVIIFLKQENDSYICLNIIKYNDGRY